MMLLFKSNHMLCFLCLQKDKLSGLDPMLKDHILSFDNNYLIIDRKWYDTMSIGFRHMKGLHGYCRNGIGNLIVQGDEHVEIKDEEIAKLKMQCSLFVWSVGLTSSYHLELRDRSMMKKLPLWMLTTFYFVLQITNDEKMDEEFRKSLRSLFISLLDGESVTMCDFQKRDFAQIFVNHIM
jgi:hypothetical protein